MKEEEFYVRYLCFITAISLPQGAEQMKLSKRLILVTSLILGSIFWMGCASRVSLLKLKVTSSKKVTTTNQKIKTGKDIAKHALVEWSRGMDTIQKICPAYSRFFITKTKDLRKKKKFVANLRQIKAARKKNDKDFHALTWASMEMGLHNGKGHIRYKYKKCIGNVEYRCYRSGGQMSAYIAPFTPNYLRNKGKCRSKSLRALCGNFKDKGAYCTAWRNECVKGITMYQCTRFEAVCRKYDKVETEVIIPGFIHILKRKDMYHQLCEIPAQAYLRKRDKAKFDESKGQWYYPALEYPKITKMMAMFLYKLRTATVVGDDDDAGDDSDDEPTAALQFERIVDNFKYADHWQKKYLALFRKRVHFPTKCGVSEREAVQKALKFFRKVHKHILFAAIAYTELQYQIFYAWYAKTYDSSYMLAQKAKISKYRKAFEKQMKAAYALLFNPSGNYKPEYLAAIKALGESLEARTYTQVYLQANKSNPKKPITVKKDVFCSTVTQKVRGAWRKALSAFKGMDQHHQRHVAFLDQFTRQPFMLAMNMPKAKGKTKSIRRLRRKRVVKRKKARRKVVLPQRFKKAPSYVLRFLRR